MIFEPYMPIIKHPNNYMTD